MPTLGKILNVFQVFQFRPNLGRAELSYQQDPLVNELLLLIDEGKNVVKIGFDGQPNPPKYVLYELDNGDTHRLHIDMTVEQFDESRSVLKAWWNIVHKIKIQDE